MRSLQSAVLLVVPALAQAQSLTPLTVYPEDLGSSATFASRPEGTARAEGLIELSRDHFRGIGDAGGQCSVHGFHHFAVDEDLSTPEAYTIVLRRPVSGGPMPDWTSSGVIMKTGSLFTPTGTGRGFNRIRDVFQTPVQVPCDSTYFAGVELAAKSIWPRDGHSFFAAWVSGQNVGEHPATGYTRDITWVNSSLRRPFTIDATYMMGVLLDKPVLQVGGLDPNSCRNGAQFCGTANFGLGGLFPEISGATRQDGINIRIKDAANPNAAVFLFMSVDFDPALPIPGLIGQLHLGNRLLMAVGRFSMANGLLEQPLVAPGSIPFNTIGRRISFQSVIMSGVRTLTFTNAQVTEFF